MKVLKQIICILFIISVILGATSTAFATDKNTILNVVQQKSETQYLENNQGNITKTIIDSKPNEGEVTIELKLANMKKEVEETKVYENTEVYIMVSENVVNKDEKILKYTRNIRNLADKILKMNSKTKIGIIGIKGTVIDGEEIDGKMVWGENDEGNVKGTSSNCEIVVPLTNDVDTLVSGLQSMNSSKTNYRTNLQAAVRLANKSYSNESNKVLISLYDNVPAIAIGVMSNVSYGGLFNQYATVEEAVKAKHDYIATYTKNEILELKNKNISFILLRPEDTSYDETWYSTVTGEKTLEFDGSPYVQKLYGTINNPTYGKMYSFTENNIDKIITENMYQDVKNIIQSDINNVKIIDYFPKDIVNNFEFSYLGEPSIGTVSKGINAENNTIQWDIGTLNGDKIATLQYKLKIKDMKNSNLLDKILQTNEKVELKYKDATAKDYTLTLISSPKIQLVEVSEGNEPIQPNYTQNKDKTEATGVLPKTGIGSTLTISFIALVLITIVIYKKYNSYKDVK